jgi:hypothetical protein
MSIIVSLDFRESIAHALDRGKPKRGVDARFLMV